MWPQTGSRVSKNGFSRLPNFKNGSAKGTTTQLTQFCSAAVLQEPERLLFGNYFSFPYAYFLLTCNDKSSLAIDRLCDETARGNIGVACLYCDYRDREDQMPTKMIGSLLKQFVAGLPEVPRDINEAFQTAKGQLGGRAPQLSKIIDLLPKALELYEQAFIFIDALDELRIEHRVEFIRCLRRIIQGSPNIRLFITGRAHVQPELGRHLSESLSVISIYPKEEDFRVYLTMRLDTDPDPDAMDDDLKYEILTHLPRQFSGV